MFELNYIHLLQPLPKDNERLITAILENEALRREPILPDERMSILPLDNQKVPEEALPLSQSPLT